VFHVELRRFPHVSRSFNLGEDELLARFVAPWVGSRPITIDDREWSQDKKTRLTIYEADAIAPEERGLGRGWSSVTREGRNVTDTVLENARKAIAPSVPMAELKATLLAAARAGPISLAAAVGLAGRGGRPSERLALTEQAAWELLHEGQLLLADAAGPVSSDRWESLLLAWEKWTDPKGAVFLEATPERRPD
jgi:hypothetical protein